MKPKDDTPYFLAKNKGLIDCPPEDEYMHPVAADTPGSVLTAAGASSALTAADAASGTLTATDQRTGGPG